MPCKPQPTRRAMLSFTTCKSPCNSFSFDQKLYKTWSLKYQLNSFKFYKKLPIYFDRRITAIEWLASNTEQSNYFIGISSKSGDILFYSPFFEEFESWPDLQALPHERRSTSHVLSRSSSAELEPPGFPMIKGLGPGDAITDFKFCPFSNLQNLSLEETFLIYSTSVSGLLFVHDLFGRSFSHGASKILLRTDDSHVNWFTSLCLSKSLNILAAATTKGELYWSDLREPHCTYPYSKAPNETYFSKPRGFSWTSLHRSKIQSCQFSPDNPYLLLTASNDKTACVWDWRYIKTTQGLALGFELEDDHGGSPTCCPSRVKRPHSCALQENYREFTSYSSLGSGLGALPLAILPHTSVVTCAEWDPSLAYRILTTSQNNQCQIYNLSSEEARSTDASGILNPSLVIQHPHRHFQHMTTIRASWHPKIQDVFVIGRYPDPKLHEKTPTQSPSVSFISDISQANTCNLDRKSIDVYNAANGRLISQFYTDSSCGIQSIAKFHPNGDILASFSGSQVYFWKYQSPIDNLFAAKNKSLKSVYFTTKNNDDDDDDEDEDSNQNIHARSSSSQTVRTVADSLPKKYRIGPGNSKKKKPSPNLSL